MDDPEIMSQLSRRRLIRSAVWTAAGFVLQPNTAWSSLFESLLGGPPSKLTPAVTPNDEFYLTSYRSPPTIRIKDWSLTVKGLVERPMTLSYEQLLAKPTVSQIVTLECVGNTVAGEFIGTAEWTGVSLRALLEEAGADPQAYDVIFRAADEYSDSITLVRAMAGDVLLVHHMNGVPLPPAHGFPARIIVPGCYGMKSVQWLTDIEVVAADYTGYYAQKGWTDEAVVKTMSRIDRPGHGETLQGRTHRIEGLAFAGTRGITLVEVSTDAGETWHQAELHPPQSPASWVFWHYNWVARSGGRHSLLVRAIDGTGRLQTSVEQDPAPDGATGLHEITVRIES